MDDLSKLGAGLGGSLGADPVAGLAGAIQAGGGLDGLLGQLRQGGLDHQVDSWVAADRPNEPVDPQRLGAALGPDTLQRLSAGSGIDIMALLPMLAAFLPRIIDMLTPDGTVPPAGLDGAAASGSGPDLGGLLGGLLGSSTGGASGSGGPDLDDVLGGLGGLLGGSDRDR